MPEPPPIRREVLQLIVEEKSMKEIGRVNAIRVSGRGQTLQCAYGFELTIAS